MNWMLFRLNGVSHAYWQEYRILTPNLKEREEDYACTSGSLFWEENGLVNHLLCDIGFGVWQSLVDFQIFTSFAFPKSTMPSAKLAGILITHPHIDHIGELIVFVESWNRLGGYDEPVQLYITQPTFNQIQTAYPWILGQKNGKDQVNVNTIFPSVQFSVGEVKITPIDASSHCWGGVNFLIDVADCRIFLGWDIKEPPEPEGVDWSRINLAFLDGNTIEDHPTGHCSVRKILNWAEEVGLKKVNLVHYSGWEDGKVLSRDERWKALRRLNPAINTASGLNVTFGFRGQLYEWQEGKWKYW
jgi:ribonuclease BN (tRNA processing enzyme)